MTAVVPIESAKPAADAAAADASACCWSISARPTAPIRRGVRVYLKEFLSDPRVIENQGLLWKLVLNGIILRIRPARKARDYLKIWNTEKNESPLKTITRAQSDKLAAAISDHDHVVVDWAMRYGNPSIRSGIDALTAQGCDRLLVVPLYPQYSAATSATVCDEVFRVFGGMRVQPTLAGDAALLRRSGLYRGAGGLDRRASRDAAVSAGADRGLVPRHAAEIHRQGRSLSGAMHCNDARRCASAWALMRPSWY